MKRPEKQSGFVCAKLCGADSTVHIISGVLVKINNDKLIWECNLNFYVKSNGNFKL
jgi:hypothetical protein